MRTIYFLFCSVVFLAIPGSCSQSPQQLTKEESLTFAKEIEVAIKKNEGEFIDNSFDRKTFVDRIKLSGLKEEKGLEPEIMKKINLGKTISNSLSDWDDYTFIKHYIKDEKHHLIFRLYSQKESTLNYHDFELVKVNDKCRIADVYIYISGETFSETLANLYKMLVKNGGHDGLENADDLKNIRGLIQRGKADEAKKMYDKLPAYVKKAKAVLLLNVLICSNLSNDEYAAAISTFNEKYPNEPNMNLMMIDGYFLQKEYSKMLGAINALDSQINKDPLLDFYRYLSYNLLLDDDKAKASLDRLLKNMPDFQRGYLELIAVELEAKHKPQADSLIKIYRGKTKFNQDELDNVIAYYQ